MTDASLASRPSCILLGLPDDPRTHFAFAHPEHRCHALKRAEPVDESFQQVFCLTGRHGECPRYQVWAAQRPATGSALKILTATAAAPSPVVAPSPAAAPSPVVAPAPIGAAGTPETDPDRSEQPGSAFQPQARPPSGDASPPEAVAAPATECPAGEDTLWAAILGAEVPAADAPLPAAGAAPADAPAEGDSIRPTADVIPATGAAPAGGTPPAADSAPPAADSAPPASGPETSAPGLAAPAEATERASDEPSQADRLLERVPTAAPSLALGGGPDMTAPERHGQPSRLGALVRGAVLTVLLVAAGGAAGYGLAFLMTSLSAGAAVGLDVSPPSRPASLVPGGSTNPPTTLAPLVTSTPTRSPSATASAQRSPAPSPTPLYRVHVVKAGETISVIAARYNTTVQAIADLNKRANPNRIYTGQKLLIPPP